MSSSRLFVAALVACAMASSRSLLAQGGGTSTTFDTAAVLASAKPDIDAANAAWLPGLRRRDAASIVAAYSDTGMFVAVDGRVIRGRDAIAALYTSRFPQLRDIRDGGVEQDGIAVIGRHLIYEWGRAWLEMAPAKVGDPPARGGGAYLTVWHREGDGHWRIYRNLTF